MIEPAAETEYDGLTLAHDPDDAVLLRSDSVMGITQTTRTLVDTTPVRPIQSALDLGCGSGLFALLAARRAERVVATDLNPRACEITLRNAAANGVANVEARVGSLYEPVAGERFDLIASNLPFVVSPDTEYVFRDGGFDGDEISRLAVTAAPDHLTNGGIAVITACWAVPEGRRWQEAIAAWTDPLDCDALVLGGASHSPHEYAQLWNGPMLMRDPAAYADTLERWLRYYADRQIGALCYGTIVLQRRDTATPWKRIETQQRGPRRGGGSQVDRTLRVGPLVAELDDDSFRDCRFALVAHHRLEQDLDFDGVGYATRRCRMLLSESCGLVGDVGPLTFAVLAGFDGSTSVGALIDAVIAEADDVDEDLIDATILNMRDLASIGLLELVGR